MGPDCILKIVISIQTKRGMNIKFDNNNTIINCKLVNWFFKLFNGSWQNILIIKIMIAGVVNALKNVAIAVDDRPNIIPIITAKKYMYA